jgi:BirA family biotin operon repressor/biotin-[acetyl-CoA-carboxylase] ligase
MPFGSPHRHYEQCASTNDIARAWALDADDAAPHGALVSADFQTRGRGRRGRQWQAGPGDSVLMSLVLRPAFAPTDAWQLAFIAALAVSDSLSAFVPQSTLKWPNDILIQGNKVAGILVETVQSPALGWTAIVGIGVNVNQAGFDADTACQVPPISLRMAVGQTPSVGVLTQKIAQALEQRLAQHTAQGWGAIRADWRARMAPDIPLQRGQEQGIFDDLEADGRARVRMPGGTFACWATVDAEEIANTAPE